ncbi:MAG: NYN domain-containing protein [Candidatus Doudnabacteria bacterium]|nr:NYN domain-containing protein [Candidatus Doudnabacteria bacterium]
MDFSELKLNKLGIDRSKFGRIFSFIDYGNVNYWFRQDRKDKDEKDLQLNQNLIIDIEKLADFLNLFSSQKRFYYGFNNRKQQSWHLPIKAAKCGFIKITKPIQFIKHYLSEAELKEIEKPELLNQDLGGKFVEIPKSNFDVEISVDAIRLIESYDTLFLMSGDSDFAVLVKHLKRKGKKVIIAASGKVFHSLREQADLYINAQQIKAYITSVKTY